ncbi:hypothetical protein Tco_1455479 [Tanacetum coccineum]
MIAPETICVFYYSKGKAKSKKGAAIYREKRKRHDVGEHGLKPNERSGEADLSKDMSGPKSPLKLRRSWRRGTKLRRNQADPDIHYR